MATKPKTAAPDPVQPNPAAIDANVMDATASGAQPPPDSLPEDLLAAAQSDLAASDRQKRVLVINEQVWPAYRDIPVRYGCPGNGGDANPEWEGRCLTKIHLPYPMLTAWREPDPHTRQMERRRIDYVRVHRECASSLARVLTSIRDVVYGGDLEELQDDDMDLLAGLYVYRHSSRGDYLSVHAYGVAIDFGVDEMPEAVVEAFKAESWIWGGDFRSNPEPGHFEATQGR